MEDDILELFHEEQNSFTIFVVEIQFATGRGLEYFRKFKGKENYIDSNFFFVFSKDALLAYSLIIDCPSLLSFVFLIDHIEEFNPEFQWIKLLACDISKYFHSKFLMYKIINLY